MTRPRLVLWMYIPCCFVHGGLLRGHRNIDTVVTGRQTADSSTVHSKSLVVQNSLSKCLDDPDAPECLQQRRWSTPLFEFPEAMLDIFSPSSHGLPKRKDDILRSQDSFLTSTFTSSSFISDHFHYEEDVVSSSPTRDLCYGNMERLAYKKYCHSEMPSVSLEPTMQPTRVPPSNPEGESWSNTLSPSSLSTHPLTPQPFVAATTAPIHNVNVPGIGMCEGDCNTPSDCEEGLYCFERMNFEPVPGCPGTEWDGSRTDFCTNTTLVVPPPTVSPPTNQSSFRLKLYWNSSYWWQENNNEAEWCMSCPYQPGMSLPTCHEGDVLFLHYCSSHSVFFEIRWDDDDDISIIQVVDTELCLERDGTSVTVEICDITNHLQHWESPQGTMRPQESFEIGQRPQQYSSDMCLTTHHHPKLGEEIELFPCTVARHDNTSLWIMF